MKNEYLAKAYDISIHAPCVGSDLKLKGGRGTLFISIHAPCVGSDDEFQALEDSYIDFNPRSLCGERQASRARRNFARIFQSTLPVWGATAKTHKNMHAFLLSSTKYHINEYFVKIIIPENNSKSKYNL